jgi:hypothetical protein
MDIILFSCNNIFSLALGIIASFVAWFFVLFILRPRLEIDGSIYKFKSISYPDSFVYKVKVTKAFCESYIIGITKHQLTVCFRWKMFFM